MFKMFDHDPIVLGMESMFEPKQRYLGHKDTFTDLEALYCLYMQIALRLQKACEKAKHDYSEKGILPKVGDAVLFRNHNKTGFSSNFLSGYHVVQKINDSTYIIKHTVSSRTSQVHIKDLIVSPMICQVLQNIPLLKPLVIMASMPTALK